MSSTLVIHPTDASTDSLKVIYKDKGYDVINNASISKEELRKQIKSHDRIIMLGHGCGMGLLNPNYLKTYSGKLLLIDDSFADILKEKETISIWCYSDVYFKRHNIPGFHTGMIISEVDEERLMLGYVPLNKEEINNNMLAFSQIIRECLDMSAKEMKEYVLRKYNFSDPVTIYNRKNIIVI